MNNWMPIQTTNWVFFDIFLFGQFICVQNEEILTKMFNKFSITEFLQQKNVDRKMQTIAEPGEYEMNFEGFEEEAKKVYSTYSIRTKASACHLVMSVL